MVVTSGCQKEPQKDHYWVTFDPNGGSGSMSDQEFVEGESQSLKLNAYTRNGYSFKCWTESLSNKGSTYADGATISIYSNKTLYAVWEEIDNGGSNGGNNGGDNGGSNGGNNGGDNGGSNDGGGNAAPYAPTGLSAEVSGTNILVSWNRVSNADTYYVYWSATPNGDYVCYWQTADTYIYDNEPYENNYYKVKAANDYGTSSFSSYAYCHYSTGGGTGGDNGGGGTSYTPCPPSITSKSVQGCIITINWSFSSGSGCGTPTSIEVGLLDPDTNTYVLDDPLPGTATSWSQCITESWLYNGWATIGIRGVNSAGRGTAKVIKYKPSTNEWIVS